jgi:hypothetical protein
MREGKLSGSPPARSCPWPITLFQQTGIAPEDFFARLYGGRSHVSLDLILETPLGSVGIFMLPLTTLQVNPGEASLMPLALEGIRHASGLRRAVHRTHRPDSLRDELRRRRAGRL